MTMTEALILGIVQGLTEFLPVSSTAHLILFPWFYNWGGDLNTLTFAVALHAGTLLSLLACFWRDWADLLLNNQKMFLLIIVASFPAGISGFLLNDYIEYALRSPYIIAVMLVVFGMVMLAAEKMNKTRTLDSIDLSDALMIGIAQAVALIPGVSRAGITISAGLFRGLERGAAARFSFLLATPIIAGATLLHGRRLLSAGPDHNMQLFLAGFVAAAVSGYIAIKFLLNFLKKHPMNLFVYYRFGLACIIIAGIWLRR